MTELSALPSSFEQEHTYLFAPARTRAPCIQWVLSVAVLAPVTLAVWAMHEFPSIEQGSVESLTGMTHQKLLSQNPFSPVLDPAGRALSTSAATCSYLTSLPCSDAITDVSRTSVCWKLALGAELGMEPRCSRGHVECLNRQLN